MTALPWPNPDTGLAHTARRVPNIDGPTGHLCYRCALEPIADGHHHLGQQCLDADSADTFERDQAAGYRDGLDVTNRRPTLPEFRLERH